VSKHKSHPHEAAKPQGESPGVREQVHNFQPACVDYKINNLVYRGVIFQSRPPSEEMSHAFLVGIDPRREVCQKRTRAWRRKIEFLLNFSRRLLCLHFFRPARIINSGLSDSTYIAESFLLAQLENTHRPGRGQHAAFPKSNSS